MILCFLSRLVFVHLPLVTVANGTISIPEITDHNDSYYGEDKNTISA